ncbi:aldehyde dehydrogenase [Aureimonas fodinaquatilis]|uniref:Aldehyde dehydrogenase n=1 Tax=Aureimonas fodinaquatilis TaxID=2565783 RepID=A0A5B0DV92_9HYPH|nr:aldehyde dehydrogenase [Aureimonas fodinaquatilis]KAA0969530.1 aldehyde dehydrogenase [Aureimonas fodinaquatilis]
MTATRSQQSDLELDLFIDGAFRKASSHDRSQIHNPATGAHVGSAAKGTADDMRLAVETAAKAFDSGVWSDLDALDRGHILHAIGDALKARLPEFAELETRVTGRPIREMTAQMSRLPEWFYYFGGIARGMEGHVKPFKGGHLNYTQFSPLGVVGLITSWNHPLLIFLKKLAPALAAGNAVVAKPAEIAPLTPLLFAELATQAGLPAGILNIVTGEGSVVGPAMCSAPRMARIDLTGGTETGRRVAGMAAQRLIPATMELGGKAPVLVFDDTPLEEAVNGAAFAGFIASGQTCVAGTRFIVQDTIYEAFIEKLAAKVAGFKIGDPLDRATEMGPVISRKQMETTLDYIESGKSEGARLVTGGARAAMSGDLADGYYVEPTIFADVNPSHRIVREEIFGPVICVMPFTDEKHALQLANDHEFGLGASVWTRNVMRAHRVVKNLNAGIVWINDHHKNDPASIWGGFGSSGYGKENGWNALHEYSKEQNVVVRLTDDFPDWYGGGDRYS